MRAFAPVLCTIVLVAMSSPASAHHHRHCVETDTVVGYQQCSRYGARWTAGRSLSWELGVAMLALPVAATSRPLDDGTTAMSPSGSAAATAVRIRNIYNLAPHFFVASELTFGQVTSAPSISTDTSARETMPTAPGTYGHVGGVMLAIGTGSTIGPVRLGVETAFGARLMLRSSDLVPGTMFGDGGFALEARAHGNVWLSEHWSAGLMVGTSVLERGDYSITAGVGLHALPFDGGT